MKTASSIRVASWIAKPLMLMGLLGFATVHAEEYKVGFFGPLSGPVAVYGSESLAGTNFALAEIAKSGMLGKDTIKLIVADDAANPGTAAQAVQRMIEADGVVSILGGSTSSGTAAAIEVTRAAQIPQLSPLAVDPALTQQNNPWFARITQSADAFATNAAQWMVDRKKAKTAYLLVRNDNWGQPLAKAFSEKAEKLGLKILGRESYEPTAREFKPMLAEMAKTKPDFLVVMGYYTETGLMVKQMAELNFKTSVFAMTAPGIPQYLDIAGPAADGTYGVLYYYAGSIETDAAKRFVKNWQAAYKRLPSQYEGMGYDSAYVMAEAIKRAQATGKVTPKSIRDGIFATKNFQGATGPITILPSGDSQRPLPFVVVRGRDVKLDYLLK
jgi:branched-chain amino acid transport system substrate-binding protein